MASRTRRVSPSRAFHDTALAVNARRAEAVRPRVSRCLRKDRGHDRCERDAPIVDAADEKRPISMRKRRRRGRSGSTKRELALDGGTWSGPQLYATATRTSVMSIPAWPPEADAGVVAPPELHRARIPATRIARAGVRGDDRERGVPRRVVRAPRGRLRVRQARVARSERSGGEVRGERAEPRSSRCRTVRLLDRQRHAGLSARALACRSTRSTSRGSRRRRREISTPATDDNPYRRRGRRKTRAIDQARRSQRSRRARSQDDEGFFVALDRDFTAAHARWWRTAEGFAIPYERIVLQTWSPSFHGSWIKHADGAGRATAPRCS